MCTIMCLNISDTVGILRCCTIMTVICDFIDCYCLHVTIFLCVRARRYRFEKLPRSKSAKSLDRMRCAAIVGLQKR